MNGKLQSLMMTILMIASALAGCAGNEVDVDLDGEDGGYEYASNVDNHRICLLYTSPSPRD